MNLFEPPSSHMLDAKNRHPSEAAQAGPAPPIEAEGEVCERQVEEFPPCPRHGYSLGPSESGRMFEGEPSFSIRRVASATRVLSRP